MHIRFAGVALALTLVACGGGDEASEPEPAGTAAPPAATATPTATAASGEGTDGEDAIKATIATYFEGIADGDGRKSCGVLTEEAQQEVVTTAGKAGEECAVVAARVGDALSDADKATLRDAEVTNVEIAGDTATATATGATRAIKLRRANGRWLIASLNRPR